MALPHVVQLPDLTPRSLSELHTACILNQIPFFPVISFILANRLQSSQYPNIIPNNFIFAF